jgi:hypothetical protein
MVPSTNVRFGYGGAALRRGPAFSRWAEVFGILGAAYRVGAAVDTGTAPRAADLAALGIDAKASLRW